MSNTSGPVKLAVRLLPLQLDEEEFCRQVAALGNWATDIYYVQGRVPTQRFEKGTPSRAYVQFESGAEAAEFQERVKSKPFVLLSSGEATRPQIIASLFLQMPQQVDLKDTLNESLSSILEMMQDEEEGNESEVDLRLELAFCKKKSPHAAKIKKKIKALAKAREVAEVSEESSKKKKKKKQAKRGGGEKAGSDKKKTRPKEASGKGEESTVETKDLDNVKKKGRRARKKEEKKREGKTNEKTDGTDEKTNETNEKTNETNEKTNETDEKIKKSKPDKKDKRVNGESPGAETIQKSKKKKNKKKAKPETTSEPPTQAPDTPSTTAAKSKGKSKKVKTDEGETPASKPKTNRKKKSKATPQPKAAGEAGAEAETVAKPGV